MLNINTSAFIKVSPPFNITLGDSIIKVTIISKELLNEISTYNPLEAIYKPYGLSSSDYTAAVESNAVEIVTFKDCKGNIYRIPTQAITLYDKEDVTEYVEKMMMVNLGIHPNDIDLSDLQEEIRVLVQSRIGVNPQIDIVNTSNPIGLTADIVSVLEAERSTVSSATPSNELETVKAELTEANEQLTLLQGYVTSCDCTCN